MVHDEGEFHAGVLGAGVAGNQVGLGLELEGKMPHTGLLVLGGVFAADVRQSEVVIGVAVAEKARLVVRLAIDLLEADDRLIEFRRSLVVADEQVGMPQPARPEEIACFRWLRLAHDRSPPLGACKGEA